MTNIELTPPNNSEQTKTPSYAAVSEELVKIAEKRNSMQRLVLMREFLDTVYADANKGDIVTSGGDVIDGVDMTDRFSKLVAKLNNPQSEEDPFGLLPRSGELRASFVKLLSTEATAGPLVSALTERSRIAEQTGEKQPTVDEIHAVGGQAIESSQLVPIETSAEAPNSLRELTQGLSDDDRLELRSYANAKIGKREAQKDGDGQRSTLEGQYMGQSLRAMSPKARMIADTYVSLYERS